MNKRHYYYLLTVILLLIVVVAGWFATDYLGNRARLDIIEDSKASLSTLSVYVNSTLTHIEGAVKTLAGSPWIAPALVSKRDQDLELANSVLDRYNSSLDASVSYLIAADGMTVASSNRKASDSFVGKSYRFRPYFEEAAKGQADRYFALGITSGKRGFYASYPVRNRLGKVLGVVTMKKDLDEMETFFTKYPFCFLINPDGIIFMSSSPPMVLKSLWPLDKAIRDKLIASRQFGNELLEPSLFNKEIDDGMEVTLQGKDYFFSRNVIDSEGWSIVLLTPTVRIRDYKLIGILTTILGCSIIIVFAGILYVIDRSKEYFRQSEEGKRLLLHAAGEGILGVDAKGHASFVNPAALRMLGFAEDEMLGHSVHDLIHHSHKDGSNYPVEDCPMSASCTQAIESCVIDEMLWRKDGSSFPVEYSSMPIIKNGKSVGAVVTFRDITERKRAEDAFAQKNCELEKAYGDLKTMQSQLLQQEKMASIGQLAAGVAHEINNPMAFIMSNLNTLQQYANKMSEFIGVQSKALQDVLAQKESADTALSNLNENRRRLKIDYITDDLINLIKESLEGADRVKKIVQDLKGFSRIDEAEYKEADINSGIESTINIIWNELKYKTKLNKEYGNIPMTKCYAGQLNQVFMNIMVNAAQAIKEHGDITVRTWNDDKNIYISISDTGSGIPEDKLSRIFEPFYTTKEVGRGTGLGLSIAYDIVKKHNGEIKIESKVGKGTKFTINIPVVGEV